MENGGDLMKKLILFLVFAGIFQSCHNQMIYLKNDAEALKYVEDTEPQRDEWVNFFLWGLYPEEQTINPYTYCKMYGNKTPVAVENRTSFLNGILIVLTYGIYYPVRQKFWCENQTSEEKSV
jgi:hypothetical protein